MATNKKKKREQTTDSELRLWQLIAEGDMIAFRKLFDIHYVPMCRFAEFWLRDKGLAEETVLDLFTYIWLNAKSLEVRSSVKSYLFRAVRNRALNKLRVNKLSYLTFEELEDIFYYDEYEQLEADELMDQIQIVIDILPQRCQEVFRMSREEQKSHIEIAEELGISTKTVESHITLALSKIRKHLDKNK